MSADERIEGLLRELAPKVLAALVRRYGNFDAGEDAVQEALVAAATQWPDGGVPDNPHGWLLTVATRRLTDRLRSERARRGREEREWLAVPPGDRVVVDEDDTLTLLFLCCHPSLSPPSQLALTLRAVGGLTTAEIARAFLVPESTMAQRISRAKATIRSAGATFDPPPPEEQAARLDVVLHVLYLVFNEGYTATSGASLQRRDLAAEAIRLTRLVHVLRPDDAEVAGLLALMLLTDARRDARTGPDGELIPLAEQDRSRWDHTAIAGGVALVSDALARGPVGPYQLQAAIAAVHDESPADDATDWSQIVALYGVLEQVAPNPMVTLNRAVAASMVKGPEAALALVDSIDGLDGHHRVDAVRAHLLERCGDLAGARAAYRQAARRTTSIPERRWLEGRAASLSDLPA